MNFETKFLEVCVEQFGCNEISIVHRDPFCRAKSGSMEIVC